MKGYIFIVPVNDLEGKAIVDLLVKDGYEIGKDLFITKQQWGASWENLEPEIKKAIRDITSMVKVDAYRQMGEYGYGLKETIMPKSEYEKRLKKGEQMGKSTSMPPNLSNVYGVELKGKSLCTNIDHHNYKDTNRVTGKITYEEDRTNPESSLEQVAKLIGAELTMEQKFIAANDKGFVGGMIELGKQYFMEADEINEWVRAIREKEHEIIAKAQGITPEMEQQGKEAIENAVMLENNCMVVTLPHDKCITVTDRVPMQQYNGGLFIVCESGEIDYYGPSERVELFQKTFGGWTGDLSQECTFFGCETSGKQIDVDKIIDMLYMTDAEVEEQLGVINSQDKQGGKNEHVVPSEEVPADFDGI